MALTEQQMQALMLENKMANNDLMSSAPNNSALLGSILTAGRNNMAQQSGVGKGMADVGESMAKAILYRKEKKEKERLAEQVKINNMTLAGALKNG